MEKLKNENLKKIEIKIEGDNCIISYPSSKINSMNEVPTFPQLDNELKGTVDLNLSLSSNSDDFISDLREYKRKNKDNDSNSKKKLEITNKSIFYSESNIKSSSDRNIKLNKKNNVNKNKECIIKNSVIKKLNFDLCEAKKDLDINKKLSESDRTKNKNNYLYKNKNTINNIKYNINNNAIKNRNNIYPTKKRRNSLMNYELKMNKKEENSNRITHNINKSIIRHRQNNSFILSNPFDNKNLYMNNTNIQIIEKSPIINIGNMIFNNKKTKNNKKKFKSPKICNKKRNIKTNLDKLAEDKSLIKSNCVKFRSTGNFSNFKIDNKSNTLKRKEHKIIKDKNNSAIKKNNNNKNERTLKKNATYFRKSSNINKKNMFCIKKPNKKIVPYLTSAIINNVNPKIEKCSNMNNKNNEYCSLKQYYHLKSPFLLNIQNSSGTPLTSTNGCTNGTNCTNCSTLNSPSITNNKICFKSNLDEKNALMKHYSQNSFLKNIVHNKLNQNLNENKNINTNINQLHQKHKSINTIDVIKNSHNIYKINNQNYYYKKPDSSKTLQSSKSKNSDYNNKILNKCKTNELQKILKSNVKYLHKLLTERNFNLMSFHNSNNSTNNNGSNFYENDSNNNTDLKQIKKSTMNNKLDKKKEHNIKKKNSFY